MPQKSHQAENHLLAVLAVGGVAYGTDRDELKNPIILRGGDSTKLTDLPTSSRLRSHRFLVSKTKFSLFDHESLDYRYSVSSPIGKWRIAIEQASTFGWERYVGDSGKIIGMKTFGASPPPKETAEEIWL